MRGLENLKHSPHELNKNSQEPHERIGQVLKKQTQNKIERNRQSPQRDSLNRWVKETLKTQIGSSKAQFILKRKINW